MTNIVLVDDAQARISAGPRSPKSTSMAPLSEAATSCWKRMRRASLRKRLKRPRAGPCESSMSAGRHHSH